jgi:hypothetical protein
MSRGQLASGYFLVQAIGVTGWWATLAVVPATRPHFALHDAPLAALGAFAPGDLAGIALGSLLIALYHDRGWARPLAWGVAGAMTYAAAYTLSAAILEVTPPWGSLVMVPAAAGSLIAAAERSRHAPADSISSRPSA